MARTSGRHRISRRTKIATAGLGLALAIGGIVVVTTAGDPGQARADGADSKFFVDITTVQANVRQPQPQGDASTGTFTVDCGTNENQHFNPDNFIAQPGIKNGAQHLHDYVGNLTTNADSNNQSLQAGGTTCKNGDKSAYFWPVIRIVDEEEAAQDEAQQQNKGQNNNNQGQNKQNNQGQGQNNNQNNQNKNNQNQGQGQNNQGQNNNQQNNNGQQQGQNNQRGQQGQNGQNNAQQQGQQQNRNNQNNNGQNEQQGQNNNRNNLIQGNLAQNQNRDNDQQGQNNNQGQNQGQNKQNQGQNNNNGQNNNQQNNNNQQGNQGNNNNKNQGNNQQGQNNQGNNNQQQAELEAPDENNELAGNDGEIQRPAKAELTFRGSPVGNVEAMPKFLRILYGDAKPSVNGNKNTKASWTCAGFEDKVLIDKYPICPNGAAVKRIHDFPSCWDGQNIDSENHRDHIVFPNQNGQCGNGFKAVPQLRITLTYNIPQEVQQKRLYKVDSFPEEEHNPLSDHDDFANVMSNQIMNRVVNCINTGKKCNE
ncbi:hypothetical protein JOF56_004339 [Kibdelosporangium banguiense]|uniref:DUF1996 domain-containing protein n=1 Tax=Kibdelosporangium banguiense TaxID=1365924 RepID=A0ABS4TI29_9PSEU|nr:DUF1996 domain-containing protein [Kibdelosporangium banguiense]MBP2323954.1 hypothetical protein [Kibdelosporangium banguiense]